MMRCTVLSCALGGVQLLGHALRHIPLFVSEVWIMFRTAH